MKRTQAGTLRMGIRVTAVGRHRNGSFGESFHVVAFTWDRRSMVATVFSGKGRVAVLDIDETAKGNIAFAEGNSWRGDDFEPELRAAVAKFEKSDRATIALSEEQKRIVPSDIRD